MHNDPVIIKEIAQTIIREMGWKELNNRRVEEQYIQNIIRSILRPGDNDDIKTKNSIITQATAAIRRLKPVVG